MKTAITCNKPFFWMHPLRGAGGKQHYIGHKIRRLLLATILILSMLVCTLVYVIFVRNVQANRVKAQHLALLPYVTLLETNLRIADMSESMRLTRKYRYPAGVTRVRLISSADHQLVFEEHFSKPGREWTAASFRPVSSEEGLQLRVDDTKTFSELYEYIYELPTVGPRGQNLLVSILVDDTVFIRRDILRCLVISSLAGGFLFGVYLFLKGMTAKLLRPLADVANHLHSVANQESLGEVPAECSLSLAGQSREIADVVHGYNVLQKKLYEAHSKFTEIASAERVRKIASQVAHDIRSPLTALNVASAHLENLPEKMRILIRNAVQRINDIVNDLSEKKTVATPGRAEEEYDNTTSKQLISSLIEPLVSEKRIQFRSRLGAIIQCPLDETSYGIFASVNPVAFKRVLSNLVNNAVEALKETGDVTVTLSQRDDGSLQLQVSDNGLGIPPDVLPLLMQRGTTFGKAAGSGLGLYHARSLVESWGGSLSIRSQVGVGTTVIVTLPSAQAPEWFVPSLQLENNSTVVIVDDDVSIHQVWEERFSASGLERSGIKLEHFSSEAALQSWLNGQKSQMLFLCDYELIGGSNNGLDLIERFKLRERAILVTSRYEDAGIQKRCASLGVRLIPKGLAGFVPIKVVSLSSPSHHCQNGHLSGQVKVLVLDDDENVRLVWSLEKDRLGAQRIDTFASMEECERAKPEYAMYDFAFVDKNIPGSMWRIDQVITHMKAAGVKRVYVASGENAKDLANHLHCAAADGIVAGKIPQVLPEG